MKRDLFQEVCTISGNSKWEQSISRKSELYSQNEDVRSEFARDHTRILHSTAYRRLKHKTQVFFATSNDHICTRIEHVNHVASVSDTIAKFLGLNSELVNAIAIGHDLGHAPFGHHGEAVLNDLAKKDLNDTFWHEKNGLWMVDNIETLPAPDGKEVNLKLTYAVRDGIICHCGEVDDIALFPREKAVNLEDISEVNQHSPFTWEGCVVKIADKISFIGRDIEDSLNLGILKKEQLEKFNTILKVESEDNATAITNTRLIHDSIIDLCKNSSPNEGLKFSNEHFDLIKSLKEFSMKNIYNHERLNVFKDYARLVIESIAEYLIKLYDGKETLENIKENEKIYPSLTNTFSEWIIKYSNTETTTDSDTVKKSIYKNCQVYDIKQRNHYIHSVISYISGMTDNYAIEVFNELISFK